MEGDKAYFELKKRGFKIRFGPNIADAQRLNIQGRRSHPEIVVTAVRRSPGTPLITITDVDCVGREAAIC